VATRYTALNGCSLPGIVELFRQAEGRIGEIQIALFVEHQVVRAVEFLAVEGDGEWNHRAVGFAP
jgi:hypothetical protein